MSKEKAIHLIHGARLLLSVGFDIDYKAVDENLYNALKELEEE